MRQHFVTFYSPGTFCAEMTSLPISGWDITEALRLAPTISERYNATPYAFRFSTYARTSTELDSRKVAESCCHFLGGKIETIAEIEARADPRERILLSNMRNNGYDRVVVNTNSSRWTQPLEEGDVVLDYTPSRA